MSEPLCPVCEYEAIRAESREALLDAADLLEAVAKGERLDEAALWVKAIRVLRDEPEPPKPHRHLRAV